MKYEEELRKDLITLGESYGSANFGASYAHPKELKNSSLIFNDVSYSFQKDSWESISKNVDYYLRIKKIHPNVQTQDKSVLEMQSSNSSDALAMNIFCHPEFIKWKGVKNLFRIAEFTSIDFGFKAKVKTNKDKGLGEDATEVDVYLNKNIIIECKLTETDFKSTKKQIVNQYSELQETFYTDKLIQSDTEYENYQLIRNILAAKQYNARFLLICDIRRPDLTKSFIYTVSCIRDVELRTKCEIIFWQDIAKVVGSDLQLFLKEKYGIK